MKKTALILLILTLFLPSCVKKEDAYESKNIFMIDGSLPDIGEFSGKAQKERFYKEYTEEFIPSPEYGEVIPYIGNYKTYAVTDSPNWNYEQGYASWGFCTPDGKIITDASDNINYLNYFENEDGFGYYALTRQTDDAIDEFFSTESVIIPKSGEWLLPLKAGSWISCTGSGMIAVNEYNSEDYTTRTILYDYDGRKTENINLDGLEVYGISKNGNFRVGKTKDNRTEYLYMNSDGEILSGPYEFAIDYNQNNIAYVCSFDGETYLIDSNGNRLTERDYENISYEASIDGKREFFIARHRDDKSVSDVFDESGKLVGTINADAYVTLVFTDKEEVLYFYYDNSEMIWKKLSDNSDFVSKEFGVSPNDHPYETDAFVYKNEIDNSAIIFDASGKTLATVLDYYRICSYSPKRKLLTFTSGERDYSYDDIFKEAMIIDTSKTHIYDTEKKEIIYTIDGAGSTEFVGENERYLKILIYIDMGMTGKPSYYLYDTQNGKMLFENLKYLESMKVGGKTYFNVCTENSCALYDENMNTVLKFYNE